MDTAENLAPLLNAVPDDPAAAMWANRGQGMDRALETVECVMLPSHNDFKRLVIFVFANFACSHI